MMRRGNVGCRSFDFFFISIGVCSWKHGVIGFYVDYNLLHVWSMVLKIRL